MQKLTALLLALAYCSSVFAQDEHSITSSGDYAMDLGQVYGAIRSAKFMGEICSESFPDQSQSNARAFSQWRARYLPFMQEMEKHFSVMAWRESGGDPQKHVDFLADAEKSFDGYRAALKSQMTADGPDTFANQCKLYPTYLDSDRMDLERYYAEQVAVIRKGPAQ
jgi:hypothetical protein